MSVEAPHCLNCGYSLQGLPDGRCPECGTEFDPLALLDAVQQARLPWERPERGGPVRRLLLTTWHALAHPGTYWTQANERKGQRVSRRWALILTALAVSIMIHAVGRGLEIGATFLRFWGSAGSAARAWQGISESVALTWGTSLYFALWFLLGLFLTIVLTGALFGLVFRKQRGAFRGSDLVALYSPALVLGSAFGAVMMIAAALTLRLAGTLTTVAMLGPLVFLLLLVWFSARRLLAMTWPLALGLLVVVDTIDWLVAWIVGALLSPLLFMNL